MKDFITTKSNVDRLLRCNEQAHIEGGGPGARTRPLLAKLKRRFRHHPADDVKTSRETCWFCYLAADVF